MTYLVDRSSSIGCRESKLLPYFYAFYYGFYRVLENVFSRATNYYYYRRRRQTNYTFCWFSSVSISVALFSVAARILVHIASDFKQWILNVWAFIYYTSCCFVLLCYIYCIIVLIDWNEYIYYLKTNGVRKCVVLTALLKVPRKHERL